MTKTPQRGCLVRCRQPTNHQFLSFAFLSFVFVSYLVLRISDLEHAHSVRACYRLTLESQILRNFCAPVGNRLAPMTQSFGVSDSSPDRSDWFKQTALLLPAIHYLPNWLG